MANNDLEKYAKALDKWVSAQGHDDRCFDIVPFCSAIMKYHSLKMEEVNDTMRHLWNKTYQGTGELSSGRRTARSRLTRSFRHCT